MKKFVFLATIIIAMGFVACGDSDSEDTKTELDTSQFAGKWCTIDGVNSTATELTFSARFSIEGFVLNNLSTRPKVYEELTGSWVYYPENSVLVTNIFHPSVNETRRNTYTVQKLDENEMQLRSQTYGIVDTYYRLVETYSVDINEEFDISYVAKAGGSVSCSTTNSSVAKVDNNGHVTATGRGIAYVTVVADGKTVVVKVSVRSLVEQYIAELNLTIDDVMKVYGTPDAQEADAPQEGQNQRIRIAYFNPSADTRISTLQFQYDEVTRMVVRIWAVYRDEADFQSDASEVRYYYYDHTRNSSVPMYGEKEAYMENEYFVTIVESSRIISYMNFRFFK